MTVNNLASVMDRQGLYAEAQPLYERALAINELVLGHEHPDTATSVNNLAGVMARQGRYAEAQELYERALAVTEVVLGHEHPNTRQSRNSLASVLVQQGRYGEAQPLYERSLAIHEAVLGLDHPDTATSMSNLSNLITAKGYVLRAVLLNNFAVLLASEGCYKDVQRMFEQALVFYEPFLRLYHSYTTIVIENMGCLLMLQDRSIEALGFIERACILYEESIGFDHEMTKRLRVYGVELKESIQL